MIMSLDSAYSCVCFASHNSKIELSIIELFPQANIQSHGLPLSDPHEILEK
ncbi:hypothetical protein HanXRQr2_Chr02g0062621 [Helianthus annuus]|uniref:Uncharacterized protein n=1 Tax=Helianthus annuus TaxID=4232 RepID=A0A9K3JM57_HELAN|nr:hypothetical protein HanXRQr2_Chr02g0062621 [Helianthus annuus]KAJ0951558.1 hypothetical protein HanPSC8_Chr02g0061551 [Helianthus annuus]